MGHPSGFWQGSGWEPDRGKRVSVAGTVAGARSKMKGLPPRATHMCYQQVLNE